MKKSKRNFIFKIRSSLRRRGLGWGRNTRENSALAVCQPGCLFYNDSMSCMLLFCAFYECAVFHSRMWRVFFFSLRKELWLTFFGFHFLVSVFCNPGWKVEWLYKPWQRRDFMKTKINSSANKTPNHNIWKTSTNESALLLFLAQGIRLNSFKLLQPKV